MAEVKVTITGITDTGGYPRFASAEFTDRYGFEVDERLVVR